MVITLLEGRSDIKCMSFTRWGGVSPAPYDKLNVSFHVGDEDSRVTENRMIITRALGADFLISSRQTHGKEITEVKRGMKKEAQGFDALMTEKAGHALMIQHADCQAVVIHDPVNRAVANVHCGWMGSVSGILPKTVREMEKRYGSRPQDLFAAIGPSIGPCCYEFKGWKRLLPKNFHPFVSSDHLDLKKVSLCQLKNSGLILKNIEINPTCTSCSRDFFSYRREGITGRCATVVMLNR